MEKFILNQVSLLHYGCSENQIKENVYRRVFTDGMPNMTVGAMVKSCMDVYADIMIKYMKNK